MVVGNVAPCGWVEIFGSNLATGTVMPGAPLPMEMNGTTVHLIAEGWDSYLSLGYVSPGQVNAKVPCDVPPGNPGRTTLTVTLDGRASVPFILSQ